MDWLRDLDAAIQARLEGLTSGGRPLLRTAGPLRAQGRSPVPAQMLAADKPALFYAIERIGGEEEGVLARVQALLIAEDLRGQPAAWRGAAGADGAYGLAESAARALVAGDLAGTAGAWLTLQRLAHADGRLVALQQEYQVLVSGDIILLDGQDLLGGRSIVRVSHAAAAARWQADPLAGAEQCWAKWQGRGPCRVVLAGTLWAADEAQLAAIEQVLDGLLVDRRLHALAAGPGRDWPDVAMVAWQRQGARLARPILGLWGQQVQVEFEQYRQ